MTEFLPPEFYLAQNYPNPFQRKTVIKYCVAHKTRVRLTVYNSKGELLKTLVDEEKKPGTYEIEYSASTCHSRVSGNPKEGTYFYHLEAEDYKSEKQMEIKK